MNPITQSVLSVLERPWPSALPFFAPPSPNEHDPYYSRYIDRVPSGDLVSILRRQVDEVAALFAAMTPAQGDFAYAAGKWTIKEALGHLIDTERVFAYRAASFGRQDPNALPPFEQDAWVPPAEFGRRSIEHLLAEWIVVRASTILLIEGFPAGATMRRGTASGNEITVRALLYVLPGHVDHHLTILRERYMAPTDGRCDNQPPHQRSVSHD